MTFVDPTSSRPATGAAAPSPATSGLNQLDNTQTFLNLLVTQLKNQNPDNPSDPTAFMTEIAQLTAVQSQTTLNADEETVAADSMLGRTVTGLDADGTKVTGTVTGVAIGSSGPPTLQVDGSASTGSSSTAPISMALSAVSSVYASSSAVPTTSTTSTKA